MMKDDLSLFPPVSWIQKALEQKLPHLIQFVDGRKEDFLALLWQVNP